jgi:selenocysteine-specific elongation factor
VDSEVVELARLEVEDLLSKTPYADARIVGVSSKTGDGIQELKRELLELAVRNAVTTDPEAPVRIPIDRAFHLKGLGVVVTGTLVSGQIHPGDSLQIQPGGATARIRSVQVHGSPKQGAEAGELISKDQFRTTRRMLARFTLLQDAPKALKGSTPIRCHLFSSEVLGRVRPLEGPIAPGEKATVEIRLHQPVVAVRGDRFILRRPSPPTTLGGGEILDPFWQHHRTRELGSSLTALAGSEVDSLVQWIREAGESGIGLEQLSQRLGEQAARVEAWLKELEAEQRILRVTPGAGKETHWLSPEVVQQVTQRAEAMLKTYFKKNRLATGMPKAEALERLLPHRAAHMAPMFLRWLEAEKILTVQGNMVNRPGRSAELTDVESQLSRAILQHFEESRLQPSSPAEIREQLDAKPQIFDGVMQYLLKKGDLVRLPGGLILSASAIEGITADLRQSDLEKLSVGDFKSRFELTRKWAIPLLEHLDSTGVTRRVGDQRLIVRSAP